MNNLSHASILIVDDNKQNIQVLGKILAAEGYEVDAIWDSTKVMDFLDHKLPDLILLDIMMPVIDGYEVCRQLKEDKRFSDIPIIFITALNDVNDIVKAFDSGGVDYITKPYQNAVVLARVKTHLHLKLQREHLIKTNKTKDKFFSIITHDLRNPLLAVDGLIKTFKNQIEKGQFKSIDIINIIIESTTTMMKLIDDVSLWAKSQHQQISFFPQEFRLVDLINNCKHIMAAQLQKKNITIESNSDENVKVYGDFNILETIVRNLVSNAIKFTGKNGKIIIKAKEDESHVKISIIDNGVGMGEEEIEKLFAVDKTITKAGTDGEKGTGLGLLICKDFIDIHNGKIEVESKLNEGTTFTIIIPKDFNFI